MKLKKVILNLLVLVIATAASLLLAEFGARMVLNASDFLRLEVVPDPILGAVPSPSAMAGFDKWGFRNPGVPPAADVVAVGDSHTYGNTARMVDAWPYVVGQLTGRQVYNMGLGGYGPNQYFYLSKTKALTLKPQVLLWGFYMGDDFEGAFSITYGLDYWSKLRQLPPQNVDPNVWDQEPVKTSENKKIRMWLSRHSIIYQLAFHNGLGGRVKGDVQIREASKFYPGIATSLILPDKHIAEAFRPKGILSREDLSNPQIREGMRITFELMKQMNDLCRQNHTQFMVVVIPTKEMVFSDYLEHNPKVPLDDVIDKLLVNERIGREETFKFLTEANIPYVDPLPMMKASVSQGLYASSAGDMHPNRNGYRIIGEATAAALRQYWAKN